MNNIPRPEYPRPQLVRAEWINLNGMWEFEQDSGKSGEARGLVMQKEPYSQTILVPFCAESELSGIGNKDFMPCVWYRRSFIIPSEWRGKQIILHFGACDYETTVWVNGAEVGRHIGGYSPFAFDITGALQNGENTVVVRAVDDTTSPLQATGKQSIKYLSADCFYTRTTGIWQTVWLEAVPNTYIESFRVYPSVDDGIATIVAKVNGSTDNVKLKAIALAEGSVVGEATAAAHSPAVITLKLSDVFEWSVEEPFLYDLELTLLQDSEELDTVSSYFGLRSIRIDGKRVLINNKPVFQRLVLDQGFYPDGIYTAPTDEALKRDIELSIAMGFNGARLHEKVFEPRFIYWADKLGYLVWGEYPNWGLDHTDLQVLSRVTQEWLEVLERDFNHPSIVGWCPFNETYREQDDELLRTVYLLTKSVDPTRPVIDTSGYVHVETDIWDSHNYEQDTDKFAAAFEEFKTKDTVYENCAQPCCYEGEPYFVSEYGGIWWNPTEEDGWGYGKRPSSEAEFLDRYRRLTETLLFHPKMFGFCYTQLYDVEQEVNGLYTYNREPKFAQEIIKNINTQRAAIEFE